MKAVFRKKLGMFYFTGLLGKEGCWFIGFSRLSEGVTVTKWTANTKQAVEWSRTDTRSEERAKETDVVERINEIADALPMGQAWPIRLAAAELTRLRAEVARLEAEKAELRKGLDAVSNLIADSSGVVGLHLNGDVATWDELREGGRFEDWLIDFDTAKAHSEEASALRGDREDG